MSLNLHIIKKDEIEIVAFQAMQWYILEDNKFACYYKLYTNDRGYVYISDQSIQFIWEDDDTLLKLLTPIKIILTVDKEIYVHYFTIDHNDIDGFFKKDKLVALNTKIKYLQRVDICSNCKNKYCQKYIKETLCPRCATK